MTKWMMTLAVALGAVGALGVSMRAEALPPFEKTTTYYSNAAKTIEVGWQTNLSCQYPWGVGPLHGIKTAYKTVTTEPCN